MRIIETKKALKNAEKSKLDNFIVEGKLAEAIYRTRKIEKLTQKKLIILATLVAAGGVGLSASEKILPVYSSLAPATSETEVLWKGGAILILGTVVTYAIHKNYDIEYEFDAKNRVTKLKCRRNV